MSPVAARSPAEQGSTDPQIRERLGERASAYASFAPGS